MTARVRLRDLPPEKRKEFQRLRAAARKAEQEAFCRLCESLGVPRPVPEFRFDETRRWRFDFAWPDRKVAVEFEGAPHGTGQPCPECGQRKAGAHTRGLHFLNDMAKYNAAAAQGWRVIRTTHEYDGNAIPVIVQLVGSHRAVTP